MNEFIKLENVCFKYENCNATEKDILENISFSVNRGEFVAIMGANGSGKSTLLKQLNALIKPTGGKVFINGTDTTDISKTNLIRSKVGIVWQNPDNQTINSIVEDDVAFGPENLGISPEEIRARVDKALKTVGLFDYKDADVRTLSGGQKQKLAIAGVLAMEPDCILFDEPTSMLDPVNRKEILSVIKKLNRETKITVILVSHNINEVILADRIIVMDRGSVAFDSPVEKILNSPEILKEHNIDLPDALELMLRLRGKGFQFESLCPSEVNFVRELDRLLKGDRINA